MSACMPDVNDRPMNLVGYADLDSPSARLLACSDGCGATVTVHGASRTRNLPAGYV